MGQQRVAVDIAAGRRSASAARREVAATLSTWGLEQLGADAELVVSELMSNAVIHAPGAPSYELQIIRNEASIRVAVSDSSTSEPFIRPPGDGRPGGRGLRIVEALSVAWGHQTTEGGKQVWAELASPLAGEPAEAE